MMLTTISIFDYCHNWKCSSSLIKLLQHSWPTKYILHCKSLLAWRFFSVANQLLSYAYLALFLHYTSIDWDDNNYWRIRYWALSCPLILSYQYIFLFTYIQTAKSQTWQWVVKILWSFVNPQFVEQVVQISSRTSLQITCNKWCVIFNLQKYW